ncbi:hypothetical protein [Saccharopolyspora sp. NPDC002376]
MCEVDHLADAVTTAVAACPLVAGLHGGRYGHIATYMPGRRVVGIRLTETELAIHIVARYPFVVAEVADQVRAAVAPYAGGLTVTVVIEDLEVSGQHQLREQ